MKSSLYDFYQQEDYYYFHTDHNLTYFLRFNELTSRLPPMLGVFDLRIFDFEFFPYDPTPATPKPQDPRVGDTLIHIVKQFFENECRVMIYLCDASDGRPKERQTLFSNWCRKMSDWVEHRPITLQVEAFEVYGGIITQKDFPYHDVLKNELTDKAADFIAEKFGG